MRGVVLCLLVMTVAGECFTQNQNLYKEYISGELVSAKAISGGSTYMIEGDINLIKKEYPSLEVLRSIDAKHHVIQTGSVIRIAYPLWKVNDLWKLDLEEANSNLVYVIVKNGKDIPAGDFQVIRHYPSSNTYVIRSKHISFINDLLPSDDVLHITDKIVSPFVESRVIDMNLNPNRVNKIHHLYPDLNGYNETISIQENQFRSDDIDLINRTIVTGLESERVDNHAIEMATIIGGAGNSFVTGRGVASQISLTSSDFADAMPDSDESYFDLGINIQNHSYGINRTSEYGVQARAFDLSATSNKSLLHVFSSGNQGTEISSDGRYQGVEGYANLTGNIKMTKNSLVVGSVDTVGNIPSFVSRGPAYDGRVKPEVVAYSVVGSSNSAALVSGVAVLLQEQYEVIDPGQDMSSALLKALIISGTDDVGAEGLDFLTGYGNVNAWKSLQILQNSQYHSGIITDGGSYAFSIDLPSNAKNLKVTLVWTDPAANVGDFKALVNDLDLRLNDGVNDILPWVLDPTPTIESLSRSAIRSVDTLNNVEQVTIMDPGLSYSVNIEPSSITSDQEFSVAWHYDLEDQFEWDFPTGSDNMPYNGETDSYFRWSSTKPGAGALSYTVDGTNWNTLDSNVDLSLGYWRWNDIPDINSAVRARLVIDGESFETDLFTVSKPLKASIGFNCADSLLVRWDNSPSASNYTVSFLGVEKLEALETTSDTFLIISNTSELQDSRLSIRPNLANGKSMIATPTFDYTQQGIECFASSFFQTVALDTGIYLNLTLGTSYGIESITFDRYAFNGYEELETITNISSNEISYLDDVPIQGYNEHRAILRFINGEELILNSGSVYYITESPLRIFPNPVESGDFLTIITKEFEDRTPILEVVDQQGGLVHRQEIFGSQDVIPTGGMKSGIYYYRLKVDGMNYSGRILIR